MQRPTTESAPRRRASSRDRGAALILTVIVIMVLTTLGLAMVAFTTTEERTATTYRDSLQTRALAEAGVRVVQEMFRNPEDRNLVPLHDPATVAATTYDYYGTSDTDINTTLNAIGIWRKDRSGATPARYSGNNNKFFYPPFRASWSQTFGGTYSTTPSLDIYDLRFNCFQNGGTSTTLIADADTKCWLDTKINSLLTGTSTATDWNLRPGKITDISFYGPPAVAGSSYGITTVRVTAEKHDNQGNLLARETTVALIGDRNPEPAVLGNGNIELGTSMGDILCGDGCEQIHSNGTANVGNNVSGGQTPIVTAVGTATGGGSTQSGASHVTSPEINPWDDIYKPSSAADEALFYLVAARPLPAVWTDGNNTHPASRDCGYSTCQDYGLEYPAGSTTANTRRLATDTPNMYKWHVTNKEWTPCGATGNALSCDGLSFTVVPADDFEDVVAGASDTASVPHNKNRRPMTTFTITAKLDGATVLVDGKFIKTTPGNLDPAMTIIAAGSIIVSSNNDWMPASATQRAMWISGRDISAQANCCTPSNQCATNLANDAAQGIYGAHEQIQSTANTVFTGILIAENRAHLDPTVSSSNAIDVPSGSHGYKCGTPSWPWVRATKPEIFSITTATD